MPTRTHQRRGLRASLRNRWLRIRTVPGLGRDVGALSAVVVLGLATVVVILGHEGVSLVPWGHNTYDIKAEFSDVAGVNPDKAEEVRIAGVRVGTITGASATKNGTSMLTLSVSDSDAIYSNATAVLRPKNPLNEMYVEINPGGPPGHKLPGGGVIPVAQTQRPVASDEVFDNLDEQARSALTNLLAESDAALASASSTLPGGLTATDQTVVALKPVVTALAKRRALIKQLVTSISQISVVAGKNDDRLAKLVDATESTLSVLSDHSTSLTSTIDDLPGLTTQLKAAMAGSTSLAQQLNPVLDNVDKASKALPAALRKVTTVVDRLNRTVVLAKPVIAKAGPIVTELRPIATDVNGALANLEPVTRRLNTFTAQFLPFLPALSAFVYNTSSLFVVGDANGGVGRGEFEFNITAPLGNSGCVPTATQPCTDGAGK